MNHKRATFITLGCPKNIVISDKIKKRLIKCGYRISDDTSEADLILINTCGFIEPAKEESIEAILEIASKNGRGGRLAAFGCLVQRYKDDLSKSIPEVDYFWDYADLANLEAILDLTVINNAEPIADNTNAWSYLQIADGCSRSCSFCAIPLIKGPYESRPKKEIVNEAKALAAAGVKELTLIAQDTSFFGKDLSEKTNLRGLIGDLSAIDQIEWIRLMYLQPDGVDAELINMIRENEKINEYLDIPFQHADKKILRSMKRTGSGTEYLRLTDKVRESVPGIAIRTAVIVGYPGETEKQFSALKKFIIDLKPDYLGVFEFSAEEGTGAGHLPDHVDPEIRRERLNEIRFLGDELAEANRQTREGQSFSALIEEVERSAATGRLEWQAPEIDGEVIVHTDRKLATGDIVTVRVTGHLGYDVVAELRDQT